MKTLKADLQAVVRGERGVVVMMAVNLLLAIVLAVFAFVSLNPSSARTKFGYSDIVAYRDGSWADVLAFPLLALIMGVLHSFISLRIYHKRGGGMAKFFLIATSFLLLGALLVLIRILGEG